MFLGKRNNSTKSSKEKNSLLDEIRNLKVAGLPFNHNLNLPNAGFARDRSPITKDKDLPANSKKNQSQHYKSKSSVFIDSKLSKIIKRSEAEFNKAYNCLNRRRSKEEAALDISKDKSCAVGQTNGV